MFRRDGVNKTWASHSCPFSFFPHIKCLSALTAKGKADIKIGLLQTSSAPFVTLPLEPNCMSTLCPLWCLPGRDRLQVTPLWSALAVQALIKLGWWMGGLLLEMSPQGWSGNMSLWYFLGGIYCLAIRNMGNKEVRIASFENLSFLVCSTTLQRMCSFSLWYKPPIHGLVSSDWDKHIRPQRLRCSSCCVLTGSFPHISHQPRRTMILTIFWLWFAALRQSEWHARRGVSFLKGGAFLLERILNEPGRGPGSVWRGLRIK